ncbi:MAG: hypothetical protein JNK15_00025 [Planctomycetes bacterium]|nr:hypothetical protein [Planctomycetota bacterium]
MTVRRFRWLLPLLVAAGCTTRPQDPFVVAERAVARRELAAALQALDGVPVEHAHYPEARALALEVERQMRRGHELVLEGLMLRAEWRDDEALVVLRRAASSWPELPGIAVLVRATEQRLQVLGASAVTSPKVATGADPTPATATPLVEVPPKPPVPAVAVEPPADATRGATPKPVEPVRPAVASSIDPVSAGLVAVEQRLGANQLEDAVLQLLELARRFPDDARVRLRLGRLLHQRALLHYGGGNLAPAIADWRRVLELDPANDAARELLRAAETEAVRSRG